jgi:hypothetical protein
MRGERREEVGALPYMEFPKSNRGAIERKRFWLSDDGLALIAGFRREGMTMEEIYNGQVGVSSTTWRSWLASSDGLREAIAQTDEQVNCLVERALLRRALGYEVVEEDEELVEGEMRVVRRRHRHVPPDTKAQLAWLYSRRADRWRASQDPRDATTEQLRAVDAVVVSIAHASVLPDGADPQPQVEVEGSEVSPKPQVEVEGSEAGR